MLGYTKEDLDNMIDAVASAITTVNSDNDPWLHGSLSQTQKFFD
jgi:hypothetical protein